LTWLDLILTSFPPNFHHFSIDFPPLICYDIGGDRYAKTDRIMVDRVLSGSVVGSWSDAQVDPHGVACTDDATVDATSPQAVRTVWL
jgi:hypothetical protein